MSKLNKKLAHLKQQQQRLKLRLQAAKEQACRNDAASKRDALSDPSETDATLPSSSPARKGE